MNSPSPRGADLAGWRVWYADGSVYASDTTAWVDLPEQGVVVVAVYEDRFTKGGVRYRRLMDGADWYWLFGKSGTNDERGVWIDPPADVAPELLKRGVWVSDLTFDIISRRAWDSRWP